MVYVDFFGVLTTSDIAARIEGAYSDALTGRIGQWFTALRRTFKPTARLGGGPIPAVLEVTGTAPAADDPLAQRLGLPVKLHERTGKRVLVAFDEFQDVLAAGPADAAIRAQIQHHSEAASYIFAGSNVGMMAELFADKRRAFYAQAKPISLPPLPSDQLGDYITASFAVTGKDVGVALGPLLDAAAGHPQRAMLLAYTLWDTTPPGGSATEETWVEAYETALADNLDEFKTLWAKSSVSVRRVLALIADGNVKLYSRTSGTSRGGAVTSAVRTLMDSGDIVEDSTTATGYRVVDPLYAAWIRAGRSQ